MKDASIECLAIQGNNIFVGTPGWGVYLSTDNGNTWSARNDGLGEHTSIGALLIRGDYIYAGVSRQAMCRAKLSDFKLSSPITNTVDEEFRFTLYPNPATNLITIESNKIFQEEMKITNLQGATVWTGRADSEKYDIDISGLVPGTYFLRLGNEVKKFIKE